MTRLSTLALLAAAALPLPAQTPLTADDVMSFRIQLGVGATSEEKWDGAVTVSGGELLEVRNWHPRREDEMGRNEWRLTTHKMENFPYRAYEHPPNTGVQPYWWVRGVIVDVKARAGTRLNVRTEQGRFAFNVNEIEVGRSKPFLGGRALVDRVPPAEKLSDAERQDDFVTMLSGKGGEVWTAWVAYRDGGNAILARRFNGAKWEPAQQVTDDKQDIFLVKLGRDIKGRPWAVWANQVDGNFDLYARPFNGGGWGEVERLTEAPQPDVFHNVVTDSQGFLWVVWQGFRDGKSDIFARRYDGDSWSEPYKVSDSPANDWEPVLAADSKGGVTVAWDTYDKGNYDIRMRTFSGGEWQPVAPVAETALYEAHVSLLYDDQNRLWAAWNESGMNWGKDTGFVLNEGGTRLYEYRLLRVAVRDGVNWKVPAGDINKQLPEDYEPRYDDFPQLAKDSEGRVWVFARQRIQRRRDTQSETPLHRAAWEIWGSTLDGGRWSEPLHVPFSQGRQDVRWGLASDGSGNLFAAWSMDNRDFDEWLFTHADVYAARLPKLERKTAAPQLIPRTDPELFFFDVAPTEKTDLARIHDYTIDSGGKRYKIYRGDTHRHTEFSMDGNNDGSHFQTYRYAIDAASLDYLMISEHNSSAGPDEEYINWLLQQFVDVHAVSGSFQPFYGYERSITYPDGHRNILFAKRGNPTLEILPAERQHEQGAGRLYAYLKERDGIAISHTSSTNMGTDWRDNDPEVEPLVEIFQGDRISSEYEGAHWAANSENPGSAPGGFRPQGYVWNAWAKGYKLGVQAASDHLSTHLSYACTIAEDFTRESMMDAMKARHSYGATDNIILDYRLETDAGQEFLQGDIVTVAGGFRLKVKVIGTTPIRQVDVIKNQQFLFNRQKQPQELEMEFVDNDKKPGEDFYYVRVIQEDDNIAWSSPIWVTTK
ncbi:MAG: hypothetical protein GC160_27400 [Acidobacteria bacterium]|nr:hypothetical protein [Acidobacteriota bacterium]